MLFITFYYALSWLFGSFGDSLYAISGTGAFFLPMAHRGPHFGDARNLYVALYVSRLTTLYLLLYFIGVSLRNSPLHSTYMLPSNFRRRCCTFGSSRDAPRLGCSTHSLTPANLTPSSSAPHCWHLSTSRRNPTAAPKNSENDVVCAAPGQNRREAYEEAHYYFLDVQHP